MLSSCLVALRHKTQRSKHEMFYNSWEVSTIWKLSTKLEAFILLLALGERTAPCRIRLVYSENVQHVFVHLVT